LNLAWIPGSRLRFLKCHCDFSQQFLETHLATQNTKNVWETRFFTQSLNIHYQPKSGGRMAVAVMAPCARRSDNTEASSTRFARFGRSDRSALPDPAAYANEPKIRCG